MQRARIAAALAIALLLLAGCGMYGALYLEEPEPPPGPTEPGPAEPEPDEPDEEETDEDEDDPAGTP